MVVNVPRSMAHKWPSDSSVLGNITTRLQHCQSGGWIYRKQPYTLIFPINSSAGNNFCSDGRATWTTPSSFSLGRNHVCRGERDTYYTRQLIWARLIRSFTLWSSCYIHLNHTPSLRPQIRAIDDTEPIDGTDFMLPPVSCNLLYRASKSNFNLFWDPHVLIWISFSSSKHENNRPLGMSRSSSNSNTDIVAQ
jgi:hypothetical protein